MFAKNRHLTDREILQEIDGELSESRRSAVNCHLGECDACSARRTAIASAASATSVDYRATNTAGPHAEHFRDRLEIALARMAREPHRPRFATAPAIAVVAVAVSIASATIYLQSAPDTNSLAARHRLALPVASLTPGAAWDVSVDELCSGTTHTWPITTAMRAAGRQRVRCPGRTVRSVRTRFPDHAGARRCDRRAESMAAALRVTSLECAREGRARTAAPATGLRPQARSGHGAARHGRGLGCGLQEVLQYRPATRGTSRSGSGR